MVFPLIAAAAPFIGSALGIGSQIFDAYQGKRASDDQNYYAGQNVGLQKQFAQYGIRWRAEDARKAGLHPLAALGASTSSFSPVHIPAGSTRYDFGKMGQNIAKSLDNKLNREVIRNWKLRNDILERELYLMGQDTSDGQVAVDSYGRPLVNLEGNVDARIKREAEVTPFANPKNPGETYGTQPGFQMVTMNRPTEYPRIKAFPRQMLQETLSEIPIHKWEYSYEYGKMRVNAIKYYLGPNTKKAKKWERILRKLRPINEKKGNIWMFDPYKFEWVDMPIGKTRHSIYFETQPWKKKGWEPRT